MVEGYFWLDDAQWAKIALLLPRYVRGKRRVDDRRVPSGIVQVIVSGCRWSDAPLEYGPRKTLYNRLVRWAVRGIREEVFMELARQGGPPAEALLDSTHIEVRRCASGGRRQKRGSRHRDEPGRTQHEDPHDRGRARTAEGHLPDRRQPARSRAGQGHLARVPPPVRLLADAAYDSDELRGWLAGRNTRPVIPNRKNRRKPYPFDAATYKRRNAVERTFCRLKDFGRLATRYDRLDETFVATLCITAALAYFLK